MNSYPIGWRRMESIMKKWRSLHYYTENILYSTLYTIKLKICTQRFYHPSSKFSKYWHWYEKSFSLWHSGSPSLEGQSDGPLSPSDIHPSSNPKQLILSGVSLLAVSNVNNPLGLVLLPYVMWSAHFFVTHIQTEAPGMARPFTFAALC